MDKDPLGPGVDLRIVQLYGKGMARATWPRIHPHCHLSSSEWLEVTNDEGPRPSARLIVATGQRCTGVAACGCIAKPHHTPIWVEERGSYP
jgi:hypothetical protein